MEWDSTVLVWATDSYGTDGGIAAVGVDGDLICKRSKGVGRRNSRRDIEQGLRMGGVKTMYKKALLRRPNNVVSSIAYAGLFDGRDARDEWS